MWLYSISQEKIPWSICETPGPENITNRLHPKPSQSRKLEVIRTSSVLQVTASYTDTWRNRKKNKSTFATGKKILTKSVLNFNILCKSLTFKTTIGKVKEGTQKQLLLNRVPRVPKVNRFRKASHEQTTPKSEHNRQQNQGTSPEFLLKITPKITILFLNQKFLSSYHQFLAS